MKCVYPFLEQNLLSTNMNVSGVKSQTVSRNTARALRQVNSVPPTFCFSIVDLALVDYFLRIGPK